MNRTAFRKLVAITAAVLLVWLLFDQTALACPTCKDGMSHGNESNMMQGYFWSIIFMMSMPFLILASLATYFYLQIRKARAAALAAVVGGAAAIRRRTRARQRAQPTATRRTLRCRASGPRGP